MSTEQITNKLPDTIFHDQEESINIDSLILTQDDVLNDTALLRDIGIRKLASAISKMELDFNTDDLDNVTKKVSAINTLDSLLNSREKSFSTRITTRMKNKELSTTMQTGAIVSELLSKLKLTDIGQNNKIEGISKSNPIRQEELNELNQLTNIDDISTNECKIDPKDYNE